MKTRECGSVGWAVPAEQGSGTATVPRVETTLRTGSVAAWHRDSPVARKRGTDTVPWFRRALGVDAEPARLGSTRFNLNELTRLGSLSKRAENAARLVLATSSS